MDIWRCVSAQRKDVPIRYFIRETGKMQEVEQENHCDEWNKKIIVMKAIGAEAPRGERPRRFELQQLLLDMGAHVGGVNGEHLAVSRFRPLPVAQAVAAQGDQVVAVGAVARVEVVVEDEQVG